MTTLNHAVLDEHMKKLIKWYADCPLKEYRAKEGITQFQLAQVLGISTTAVHNWERGINPSDKYSETLRTLVEDYDNKMEAWLAKRPVLKNVRTSNN